MLNLENKFKREKLAFFPSPIHRLNNLSHELGYDIYAKRDDISSGLAFGGNKVRKLEWLIPEAREQGCDTLVSIGGIQSNHTRQVAAVAAATGFKCRLVQEDWANNDNGVYDKVGNILLSRMMGAITEIKGTGYSTEEKMTWKETIDNIISMISFIFLIVALENSTPSTPLIFLIFDSINFVFSKSLKFSEIL